MEHPPKSSFAIYENTILSAHRPQRAPRTHWTEQQIRRLATAFRPSAPSGDLEVRSGRFARLVGLVALGVSLDRECATAEVHVRLAAVVLRVHAGEAGQILDAHRLRDDR